MTSTSSPHIPLWNFCGIAIDLFVNLSKFSHIRKRREDSSLVVIFSTFFFRRARQPFTRISPSNKRRYSIENPKKTINTGEMSTDELAEQETVKEVVHLTMK